jgi:hypothetical protein
MQEIKVLIVGISLLEGSRRVALSFLEVRRGRSPVWVKSGLDLLHILLELLAGFFFLHAALSQWHGGNDTCQIGSQIASWWERKTYHVTIQKTAPVYDYRFDRYDRLVWPVLLLLAAAEEWDLLLEGRTPKLEGWEAYWWV